MSRSTSIAATAVSAVLRSSDSSYPVPHVATSSASDGMCSGSSSRR